MDLLDLLLLLATLSFALSGYRQGFVVGVLSLVGFVGGALLGAQLAAPLARLFGVTSAGGRAPGFGLLAVVVGAIIGQVLAATVGSLVRSRLTWRPLRAVDSVAGALVSAVSVLLVAWGLSRVAVRTNLEAVKHQVRDSAVLERVDAVVPAGADRLLAALLRLVDSTGFPQVFPGLGAERIVPVAKPDESVLRLPGVRAAQPSVLKITGAAPSCDRRVEGSGFLYAPERVMTNAHVVAGVSDPQVLVPDGRALPATVVLYDPQRDIAVLRVPGIGGKPLRFTDPVGAGASGAVAGYPLDGPFTAVPSRVRTREEIRGPDIYQDRTVTREAYVLFAAVKPGNSGGPLLAPSGGVDGVVFAASTEDANTGYALTAAEVASDAAAGQSAAARVSSQSCD